MLYDGEVIRTIESNGRDLRTFQIDLKFSRLVFVEQLDLFVGWTINDSAIHVSIV